MEALQIELSFFTIFGMLLVFTGASLLCLEVTFLFVHAKAYAILLLIICLLDF